MLGSSFLIIPEGVSRDVLPMAIDSLVLRRLTLVPSPFAQMPTDFPEGRCGPPSLAAKDAATGQGNRPRNRKPEVKDN